ncbi:magnesium transporter [Rhodobacterales bacterium HTCC2150]|nr:magnesium transporter [Rhodobacterales bacterium HTCC2150] [Rhodobacteraceae bacterium HTCC2150]
MAELIKLSETNNDADYALVADDVNAVLEAVEAGAAGQLAALLDQLHAADIADLLEQIPATARVDLLQLWAGKMDGEVLSELNEGLREEVLEHLDSNIVAEAVSDLETDDVVDLLEDMDSAQSAAVMAALDEGDRAAVEQSMSYPDDSAGRLMQRKVVVAPEHWDVGQAIDFLRNRDDLPEQFYHLILVDPRYHPVGYVTLGKLMASRRSVPLVNIVEDSFRVIPADQDEEDVAYAFNQYHLISAPVVDETDRLVGVITIDDAMAVLDEEAQEDILRLAGVGDENLSDSPLAIAWARFPWLFVNLVTAIAASLVISMFAGTITQLVALAVLMPIVASMGGNAGTQSLTVAVRALATRDLTSANASRVVMREVLAGLVNGGVFAIVMGIIGVVWFGTPMLGIVIGIAMILNLGVAALAGVLVPLGLEKAGVDPALASGAFVTTVTDVVGFFVFLGLATVMLF